MTTVASNSENAARPSRGFHIGLWVAQIILAVMFTMTGFMKLSMPAEEMVKQFPWAAEMLLLVRLIGASELAGALGMILPAASRIRPSLTAHAGVGLTIVMILAAAFHSSRGEIEVLPINIGLGSLAVFVAWGRYKKAPITPRTSTVTLAS